MNLQAAAVELEVFKADDMGEGKPDSRLVKADEEARELLSEMNIDGDSRAVFEEEMHRARQGRLRGSKL